MKLALLKGNRFNPWHLQGFKRLGDDVSVTAFRAESEIQRYFHERNDDVGGFDFEKIYFDTQIGNPISRLKNIILMRYRGREPRIVPFHERLQGFDVIQSWELFTDWSAQAVEARRKWGIPLSIMVWDNIPFNMERNPIRREIKSTVIEHADKFIVHTERSRRTLGLEGVAADRTVMVNPGVDVEVFSPGERRRDGSDIGDDDFVILFVGWLLPRKGIDFLLLALRELIHDPAMKSKRIRLMMVGSGPGRDRVEALIDRLDIRDACTFAGSVPYGRMPAVFRAADVFVLPSIATPEWQEQFGMSLIEAMACGVPVITTFSGAIPEIVGDCAMLCQPNDFYALYEAVKRIIAEPSMRVDMGAAGRERAVTHYSLDDYAKAMSSIYRGMLRT